MEPVRVKVYGIYSHTRRSYVVQAIFGLGAVAGLLIAWWFGWQELRQKLTQPTVTLPTFMYVTIAVLDKVPWILGAITLIKVFEMWIVLRRFARKEAELTINTNQSSP